MKKCIETSRELTMGLDLGDRRSYGVVLDREGEILWSGSLVTTEKGLRREFSGVAPMSIAIEASNQSMWVSRVLRELGHEVIVANPRKLRLIYENRNKQDRVDAEYLARLARVDPKLLAPIEHRSLECQEDLQLLRSRQALVRARTQLINHVRSAVKLFGERLPNCSGHAFAKKAFKAMPKSLESSLKPLVEQIALLTEQIKRYDKRIEQLCESKYPETDALLQIRGVGHLSALGFILTLQDPYRFRQSRSVGAFVGLCPGRSQSGKRDPEMRIHKQGDRYLRQLLVSCAHYILGPFGEDSDLRRHGEKIAGQGTRKAKKRAVVAVARKLAVLMHHLWKTQETYEPLYNTQRRAA